MSRRHGITVVGSGSRFISGISYYTHKLACALADRHDISVILMRRIIPRALYPGRERVGLPMGEMAYPPATDVYDGVDWFWGPTILRACARLVRNRPRVVIFQWWTGAVLHTYVVLAALARLLGARVVLEFHEVQDTGEARWSAAAGYVDVFARLLMRIASAAVIHSESDRQPVLDRFRLGDRPLAVIPHGPFDQYRSARRTREAPDDVVNVLFFGTIRPYKGLEDLIRAFNDLSHAEAERFWLTVVGETWEGWHLPEQLIESSPHRDRITFVNRYVTDEEAGGFLAGADALALPYHRSSASGPLHVAMSVGLPVIVTRVGGLPEAAGDYDGALWVDPRDADAIRASLALLPALKGRRFADPHSWDASLSRYEDLLAEVELRAA
jgi:glycosyltransferase involved in cell wall biosynthesis